jgi:hypothetical protein
MIFTTPTSLQMTPSDDAIAHEWPMQAFLHSEPLFTATLAITNKSFNLLTQNAFAGKPQSK